MEQGEKGGETSGTDVRDTMAKQSTIYMLLYLDWLQVGIAGL